ncbi:chromate transporter [Alteribacillus iranensis]|uniref:Chromate transporter n=1 Tax=Alteribacillus iranensis TaxID=930128 RepID=A0A1I2C0H6_9BACI|nr:chromate transporter [Alteribacillus iranensis]SFE61692.1 chromate transporter [Alteribacillus iranensis]
MTYVHLFIAFFLPGILGYGGGPAAIPLVQYEVVERYGWMTMGEFSEVLAIGNALPGPIATKMAGYIGYEVGGVLGAGVAVFATVAPSLILMIVLVGILFKYRDSPKMKRMTKYVRPVIAILLGVIAFQFLNSSLEASGWVQTVILMIVSFFMLEKWSIHPALVIGLSIVYGAVFLG